MADTKITALTALTAADPANDVIPIVDVSDTTMAASGTTKKISVNNILSSSPTATGAFTVSGLVTAGSATITGDLTVDTSTLKVDSTNNRVGIGTASPTVPLYVTGNNATATAIMQDETNGAKLRLLANSINFDITNGGGGGEIAVSGANPLTFKTNGTERARIDSSGNVGVGVTPSAWNSAVPAIQVKGVSGIYGAGSSEFGSVQNCFFNASSQWIYGTTAASGKYAISAGVHQWFNAPSGTAGNAITFTQAMTLDASGNLLVGKTGNNGTIGAGILNESTGAIWSTLTASTSAGNTFVAYSTGAAAYRFYVGLGGTVNATNPVISAISDARFKENVQDIDVGLAAILSLKPRKFDWKAGKGKDIKGDRGFIAQEFETVFPNLIDEWKDAAPEGEAPYKSVRQDLIPVLVKAIQELTARVQTLEAR